MANKRIALLTAGLLLWSSAVSAQLIGQSAGLNINDLPDPKLNRAVVKVKVFAVSPNNSLNLLGSGSGVIIDDKGTVLTNYHVAVDERSYDSKPRSVGYEICLNDEVDKEPDCSYGAAFIAGEKEIDLALLKIVALPSGSAVPNLKVMPIAQTDTINTNDEVIAIGYPSIGGDTMTVTRGIVSGKQEKYGKKWIKSDAMISFGNSGGAAVNRKGELIGITSAGHADFLGSLGYFINSSSIVPWIKANESKVPVTSLLADRVAKFASKEKLNETSNVFISERNSFQITKPSDWQFDYPGESAISIIKKEDSEAGGLSIDAIPFTYIITKDNFSAAITSFLATEDQFAQIQNEESVKIKSGEARRVTISSLSGETKTYIFAYADNYLLQIAYIYGTEDRDQAQIDQAIASLEVFKPVKPWKSLASLKSDNGIFNYEIKTVSGWGLQADAGDNPMGLSMDSVKGNFSINISFEKEPAKDAKLTNAQKTTNQRKQIDSLKGALKEAGVSTSYKDNANCAITAKHKATYTQVWFKTDTQVIMAMEYAVRSQGKVISIGGLASGARAENMTKARADFDKALAGLVIEGVKFKGGCVAK